MQTILGAGGPVGRALARELPTYTGEVRLVSRSPEKVNQSDQLLHADLSDPAQVRNAVKGSEIVYVTVGFPYSYKVWRAIWPGFVASVIEACKMYGSKLVFFDNIYMYDPDHLDGMDEETPINPPSRKGAVREQISRMITDEIRKGNLRAVIARSADFYGPSILNNSLLTETVLKNLASGKKANWLVSDQHKHSFTYVPDAARATAILGNTEDAYGQVWHLPTAKDPFTGKEWIHAIAEEMGVNPDYRVVSPFMVRLLGVFLPIMKESVEMLYQYDRDYVFKSDKFEGKFGIKPTPYRQGIKEIIQTDYPR